MGSMGSRMNALHGPWECHTYSHMINNVEYIDSTGDRVNICAYWDQNFGDLLEKAWAVPQLMDLLERFMSNYDTTTQFLVSRTEMDLAHDNLRALRQQWKTLLERLT